MTFLISAGPGIEKTILAALLNAFGTAAAAILSSFLGTIAAPIRREKLLDFETKRLTLIETCFRIKSQYISHDSTQGEIDTRLASVLDSSIKTLTEIDIGGQVAPTGFLREWLLLRKPHRKLLWPLQIMFYAAFASSFVVLNGVGQGTTFYLLAALAALLRLIIGLVDSNRAISPLTR